MTKPTDPLLPRAFELIQAWGFEYKTVGFYWVKLNTAAKHDADYFAGLGYWTRANPEQCILATRGKPQRQAKGCPAPRGRQAPGTQPKARCRSRTH